MNTAATLPGLLVRNARAMPARPAFRHRRHGIWQNLTWVEYHTLVRGFALGLAAHGFGRGDRLAVLGENRPRLYGALLAAQSLNGMGLPLHPDSEPTWLARILREAEASVVVVDGQQQADAILAISDQVPKVALVIYDDPRGMERYDRSALRAFENVIAEGESFGQGQTDYYESAIKRGSPEDPALLLCRPGRERVPPIVPLSHASLCAAGAALVARERLRPTDSVFCCLPMSSLGDVMYSLALGVFGGLSCNCPEAPHTVLRDLREIGPSLLLATPRLLELLADQITQRSANAPMLKRRVFKLFRHLALCAECLREQKAPIPLGLRFGCGIGELVINRPVRDQLGLGRARAVHVGLDALRPDLARLFRSLGVPLGPVCFGDLGQSRAAEPHELSNV